MQMSKGILAALFTLVLGDAAFAQEFVWPLSNSATPDAMNTSFGPRINNNRWDFHDGIDLPAPRGTDIYAMRAGTVLRAGCGRLTPDCADPTSPYRSRHVLLEVDDPTDPEQKRKLYLLHLHLQSTVVTPREIVTQGQLLGTVGDDGAAYTHLHFEFRKGSSREIDSVHPLGYLPYTDTANFTAPVLDRFNRLGTLMAARLLFGANSRFEGDLKGVEVDLKSGGTLLETRIVDFNDKSTINEGNGDEFIYRNDIGVEGYQKSNLEADGRTDLKHGVLVRNIPSLCDTLVARVMDVGGNIATSEELIIPKHIAADESLDFEDGAMPPAGWTRVRSTTGTGTTVTNDPAAAYAGSRGMLSIDASTTETSTQRAGIEYELPSGRFEWIAKGWFNPAALGLGPGQTIWPLYFLSGTNLSVAARISNRAGSLLAGIVVTHRDGTMRPVDSSAPVAVGIWREWTLHVLRIATRETTAVLYLDGVEVLRVNWDTTVFEPRTLRAGIGRSSAGATATILTDELRLAEFLP